MQSLHYTNRYTEELSKVETDFYSRLKNTTLEAGPRDFEMYSFEQIWPSTALGFGGIGGAAMTAAQTYVFIPKQKTDKCFVYFGSSFAYIADYAENFYKDLQKHQLLPVYKAIKYKNID